MDYRVAECHLRACWQVDVQSRHSAQLSSPDAVRACTACELENKRISANFLSLTQILLDGPIDQSSHDLKMPVKHANLHPTAYHTQLVTYSLYY
jgi:hypothetical protein